MTKHTPIVNELIDLLEERTDLAEALVGAIAKAARPNLTNLQQYLAFLDQKVTLTLTAREGVTLTKGEEFGFFQFGGSDIVMLFEPGRVAFDAAVGAHYNQGRQIGHAL